MAALLLLLQLRWQKQQQKSVSGGQSSPDRPAAIGQ
jgi:hypothetical protein